MSVAKKITTIIGITAVFGMLAVPAMADTTINGALFAGNGHGPGDGTGAAAGDQDGDGNGSATGDCTRAAYFTLDNSVLLARSGNGNGGGKGGNGRGDGGGSGDRDRDRDRDRDGDRDGSCLSS